MVESGAAAAAATTAASPSRSGDAPRVLRRGDLVRISESGIASAKRLKDRDGYLGRIAKAPPTPSTSSGKETYDIEWVLGGRSMGVCRSDLVHTTAQAEGMTEDASRNRRNKRKPADFMEEVTEQDASKREVRKKKAAVVVKKKIKVVAKVVPKKLKSVPRKRTLPKKLQDVPKKKANDVKPKVVKRKVADANKPKVGKKRKLAEVPPPELAPTASTSLALDVYERHRREFERIVTRLEKVDQFGFFFDEAPDEFDEKYADEPETDTDASNKLKEESSGAATSGADNGAAAEKPVKKAPVFPSHPPYNWDMVRRRMENGRYIADREKFEKLKRLKQLGPYYASLGKNVLSNKLRPGKDVTENPRVLHPKGIDWNMFRDDVLAMCHDAIDRDSEDSTGASGSITFSANKVKEALLQAYERTGQKQLVEMSVADDRHKFTVALNKIHNTEAAVQGSWRIEPFPEREYEKLSRSDIVCAGLSEVDERIALHELKTNLPDSFIGLSYRYDDTGESEAWMKSVIDEAGSGKSGKKKSKSEASQDDDERQAALALAADDGVIRAQVVATMQSLLIGVQDRVMTDQGVLQQHELRSSNWLPSGESGAVPPGIDGDEKKAEVGDELPLVSKTAKSPEVVEQPVWGMDCYTRRNISACLEADFDQETALLFVEKWLLPAINACPADLAHDIVNATCLLEGLPFQTPGQDQDAAPDTMPSTARYSHTVLGGALMEKIRTSAPPWLKGCSSQMRRARVALGHDFFRVHPKGHGSVLLSPRVPPGKLVTFYRGEVYPSWRWGEKMDAIDITQQRKELKPALPDFYNMALERPQTDPRGYGLLFVDASRKAGHGSSLSHSCAPTCEVRVAAVSGELKLVMTTLRELEMGEELTFDYNAVTESLVEYRSAVCLCGYGKCRGSFLHFATADCYQQVLNRNAPIATRFANLVKGSMKQVMSEDDLKVLRNHGFLTAAFGAISVNRRKVITDEHGHDFLDSIGNVPVWLRTFVADVLRYIEYERRALPISLICDHIKSINDSKGEVGASSRWTKEPKKAENGLSYFSRTESEFLHKTLKQQGFPQNATDIQLKQASLKVASSIWTAFDEKKKQTFTQKARVEFEKKKKAWRAAQRKSGSKGNEAASKSLKDDKDSGGASKPTADKASKISFQDADAEGVSAMEQRIQQLTQALSRVGRVLDRHREASFASESASDGKSEGIATLTLGQKVHSPLEVLSDERVVASLWNSEDGVVVQLIQSVEKAQCARPSLLQKLLEAKEEYSSLAAFGSSAETAASVDPAEGRRLVSEALLKFREIILEELDGMAKAFKAHMSNLRQEQERMKDAASIASGPSPDALDSGEVADDTSVDHADGDKAASDEESLPPDSALSAESGSHKKVESEVSSLMNELVDEVERRVSGAITGPVSQNETNVVFGLNEGKSFPEADLDLKGGESLWIEYYGRRYTLQAAADLLLLYSRTSTFFALKPYHSLESSPVEVYAREIGNSVPRSAIDTSRAEDSTMIDNGESDPLPGSVPADPPQPMDVTPGDGTSNSKGSELCKPDDIVAEVSVTYEGDYVLSQLLQWYNGGIGQRPGLPDMMGCALLPPMKDCWSSGIKPRKKPEKKTAYESNVGPRLVEWLKDPHQRGNPWPDEIKKAFVSTDPAAAAPSPALSNPIMFGSPVTDFLVTGDESSIYEVLDELDADDKTASKSASGGLLSSVDRGRPAQAVSNWIQCEEPSCMKWRKVPWHVDVDMLPEKFVCKDNVWNSAGNSCDTPEVDWDDADALVGADGKVEGSPVRKQKGAAVSTLEQSSFRIGARFDVQRRGKSQFTTGTVTKADFSGKVQRIRFHFTKTSANQDDWIEFKSPRIAPLHSKTPLPTKKKKKSEKVQATAKAPTGPAGNSNASATKEKESVSVHGKAKKTVKPKSSLKKRKADASKSVTDATQGPPSSAGVQTSTTKEAGTGESSASKKARENESESKTFESKVASQVEAKRSSSNLSAEFQPPSSNHMNNTSQAAIAPVPQGFASSGHGVPLPTLGSTVSVDVPAYQYGAGMAMNAYQTTSDTRQTHAMATMYEAQVQLSNSSSFAPRRAPDFMTPARPPPNTVAPNLDPNVSPNLMERLLRLASASQVPPPAAPSFASPFNYQGQQFNNGSPARLQGYGEANHLGSQAQVQPTAEQLLFLQRALGGGGFDPSVFPNMESNNGHPWRR